MLTRVTLTGADTSVEQSQLIDLSEEFPFVEWGILIGSNSGFSRFPSIEWIRDLSHEIASRGVQVHLSLHVCGQQLRALLAGYLDFPPIQDCKFERCQLNFHGVPVSRPECRSLIQSMMHDWIAQSTIVQLDGVNNWVLDELLAAGYRAEGLYDMSHGAGVIPDKWPVPNPKWEVGYAGGLGPENVGVEIRKLLDLTNGQRFWIDMETRIRSENDRQFDLRLCRAVLEECSPYFAATGVRP